MYFHLIKLLCQNFPFGGTIRMAVDDVMKFVHKNPIELLSKKGHQETVKDRSAAVEGNTVCSLHKEVTHYLYSKHVTLLIFYR